MSWEFGIENLESGFSYFMDIRYLNVLTESGIGIVVRSVKDFKKKNT